MADDEKVEEVLGPKEEQNTEKQKEGFPKRYVLIIMIFLGFAVQYALRVNINVAITAMCNNHTVKKNGFTVTKVRKIGR